MPNTNNTEPSKVIALAYVIVQAVILVLLIFVDMTSGLNFKRFILLGTVLEWLGILGILVSAYSIRRSLTAMPLPKEHGQLVTEGLYKFARHPMYTSVLLFSFGLVLSGGEIYKYLLAVSLSVLFYFKSVYEEIYLTAKYADYKKYAKRTPRFIPFVKYI